MTQPWRPPQPATMQAEGREEGFKAATLLTLRGRRIRAVVEVDTTAEGAWNGRVSIVSSERDRKRLRSAIGRR